MELIKQKKDKQRAIEILTSAYHRSPGINWMLSPNRSLNKLKKLLRLLYKDSEAKKGAYITNDKNGVVLLYQIQKLRFSISNIFRKIFASIFIIGLKKSFEVLKYQKLIKSIRPKYGWLSILAATDKYADSNDSIIEMNKEIFRLADKSNQPIYMETTVPKLMLLYKACGYIEYHQINHPYENLTVWFLRRNPNCR